MIESFNIGYSICDTENRFMVLRFKCPILLRGNNKEAEIIAMHKIFKVARELIYQLVKSNHSILLSHEFCDMEFHDMDTASMLYFFHENMSCLKPEQNNAQMLSELCINSIRAFKRDQMHILPLKPLGHDDYFFFNVSYDNYMYQLSYPTIQFCSHPVPFFNYYKDISFSLILDTKVFAAYLQVIESEQAKNEIPELSIDLGPNDITLLDHEGVRGNYCFISHSQFCKLIGSCNPFP